MQHHPALKPGGSAVITGAASGIGLAVARRLASLGMRVCLADRDSAALRAAQDEVAGAAADAAAVMVQQVDVSRPEDIRRLKETAYEAFGAVDFLMNNAGVEGGGGLLAGPGRWREIIGVNLWGVIEGVQAFAPDMIASGRPAAIVNTGSKQGITTPPGDTAYNVSKAGVKVVTEALAHELRNLPGCAVTAHLLIPGFTFTGFTRAKGVSDKPAAAWSAEQVADFMLAGLAAGDFYILCPDNDVDRATDNKRIRWAADDIVQNRPPLSRWHPDYKEAFERFLKT